MRTILPAFLALTFLVSLLAAITPNAEAAITCTTAGQLLETFETQANFAPPASTCFYTTSSMGTSIVQSGIALGGSKAFRADIPTNDGPQFNLADSACLNGTPRKIEWDFYFPTLPSIAVNMGLTSGTVTGVHADLHVNSAGTATVHGGDGTSQTTGTFTGTLGTITAATWYHASLSVSCTTGADSATGIIHLVSDPTKVSGASLSSNNWIPDSSQFKALRFYGNSASSTVYVDNLQLTSGFQLAAAGAIGSAASVGVTGLVGFDVDVTGTTTIARTDSGTNIRTYNAGSLQGIGGPTNTFCNRLHGVAALQNHVSYLRCVNGDIGNVDAVVIASSTLGTPDFGDVCASGSFCTAVLNDEDIEGAQDNQLQIASMHQVPFDYTSGSFTGINEVSAAWAYGTTDGKLGVMTYKWVNNYPDDSDFAEVSTGYGQAPDAVCSTLDAQGTGQAKTYLYAVSSLGNIKGYQVLFREPGLGTGGLISAIEPSLNPVFTGTPSTAGSHSVGCGEGKVAFGTGTTITVWNCRNCHTQAPLVTLTGLTGLKSNGVAVSDDGNWLTWADTAGGHVACIKVGGCYNALTNTTAALGGTVTDLTLPSGTFHGIRIHGSASSVWIATSTTISRYDTFAVTTGADASYDPDVVVLEQDDAPSDATPLGQSVATAFNVPAAAGDVLLAIIWILIFAAGAYGIFGGQVIGIALGGILGFVFALFQGLLPEILVFIIVLLAAAAVGFRFFGSRGTPEGM